MDLDRFIATTFCQVDDIMVDLLGNRRLRQRGPRRLSHTGVNAA